MGHVIVGVFILSDLNPFVNPMKRGDLTTYCS
jgi:hypothetical protein